MDTNEFLAECLTCRRHCSPDAKACPNCGRPHPTIPRRIIFEQNLAVTLFIIFLVIIFIDRLRLGEFDFLRIGFMFLGFSLAYLFLLNIKGFLFSMIGLSLAIGGLSLAYMFFREGRWVGILFSFILIAPGCYLLWKSKMFD